MDEPAVTRAVPQPLHQGTEVAPRCARLAPPGPPGGSASRRGEGEFHRGGQRAGTVTAEREVDVFQAVDEVGHFAPGVRSARGGAKMRAAAEGAIRINQAAVRERIEQGTGAVRARRQAGPASFAQGRRGGGGFAFGEKRRAPREAEVAALCAHLATALDRPRREIGVDLADGDDGLGEGKGGVAFQGRYDAVDREAFPSRIGAATKLAEKATFRPSDESREEQKGASRSQTDHIPFKIRAAGFAEGTATALVWAQLSPKRIETLARMGHAWWAACWMTGWTFAPQRDDTQRHCPDLVAWDDLDEPIREYDRAALRHLVATPEALSASRAGMELPAPEVGDGGQGGIRTPDTLASMPL